MLNAARNAAGVAPFARTARRRASEWMDSRREDGLSEWVEPLMGFANGRSFGSVLRLIAAGVVGVGAR